MNASLTRWLRRFDDLSMREKLMAAVALPALLYAAFDVTVFTPQLAQRKQLGPQLELQAKELAELRKLAADMTAARPVDRLSNARREREALQRQVDEAQAFIDRATEKAPLARVIRSMTAATPGLVLTSLRT
ncbi:aminoacyltransferase, partial [Pelomonas sp. KK5]|uniref:aminoacyltransferase n=1 Tax=Pelomonas sp. KK5 TaxID=1855730 RepID=UPI00117C0A22